MAWNDQGLIVFSIVNIVVVVLCIGIGHVLHKKEKFKRGFRYRVHAQHPETPAGLVSTDPNPSSYWFPFKFFGPRYLLYHVGGEATFLILTAQYCLIFLLFVFPFSLTLVLVNATDGYSFTYYIEHPEDFPTEFLWDDGVHQWSVTNVSPKSNRLWIHWFFSFVLDCGLWALVVHAYHAYVWCLRDACHPAMHRSAQVYNCNKDTLKDPEAWMEKYTPDPTAVVAVHIPPKEPFGFTRHWTARKQHVRDYKFAQNFEEKHNIPKKKLNIKKCKKIPLKKSSGDAIEKLDKKMRKAQAKFEDADPAGAVFVTFKDSAEKTAFYQHVHKKHKLLRHHDATRPDWVWWDYLHTQGSKQAGLRCGNMALFIVMLFTWFIPVAFLSNLDNLANIPGLESTFEKFLEINPTVVSVIEGVLPVIVRAVFNVLLDLMIQWMVRSEGPHSYDIFITKCYRKTFAFYLCAYLFFQALFSGGVSEIPALADDFSGERFAELIGEVAAPTLPLFIATVLNAGGIVSFFKLVIRIPAIAKGFLGQRKASCDRALREAWKPKPWKWWKEVANYMYIMSLCVIFSVTVPIMPILGIFFGLFRYWCLQYYHTEIPPFEGTSTLRMAHSILQSFLIMNDIKQVGLLAVVLAKEKWPLAFLQIPPLAFSVIAHLGIWHLMRHSRHPPNGKPKQLSYFVGMHGEYIPGGSGIVVPPADIVRAYKHPNLDVHIPDESDKEWYKRIVGQDYIDDEEPPQGAWNRFGADDDVEAVSAGPLPPMAGGSYQTDVRQNPPPALPPHHGAINGNAYNAPHNSYDSVEGEPGESQAGGGGGYYHNPNQFNYNYYQQEEQPQSTPQPSPHNYNDAMNGSQYRPPPRPTFTSHYHAGAPGARAEPYYYNAITPPSSTN